MSVYITADTHGNQDIIKLNPDMFPYHGTTKNDYVLIAGDTAVCWDGPQTIRDIMLQHKYEQFPFTTLFCDGNHENFKYLNSFPVEEWNGGKVHIINDSLIHLMRGQIYNIEGKTYFIMGGADSIDKHLRTKDKSWWQEEMPSLNEYEIAEHNLKKVNYTVDYVITHCCSSRTQYRIAPNFKRDCLTDWLNDIEAQLTFDKWYFGHYHIDEDISDRHIALYQKIVPVGYMIKDL